MKLSKKATEILSKMEYRFYHEDKNGNGYTYFTDRFILFRYPGLVENIPLDDSKKLDPDFLFHESYDYQAEKHLFFKRCFNIFLSLQASYIRL